VNERNFSHAANGCQIKRQRRDAIPAQAIGLGFQSSNSAALNYARKAYNQIVRFQVASSGAIVALAVLSVIPPGNLLLHFMRIKARFNVISTPRISAYPQ